MEELPIKREDAVAFFRFQVISDILDAKPGFIRATANHLAKQQFNDVINRRMVTKCKKRYNPLLTYRKCFFITAV